MLKFGIAAMLAAPVAIIFGSVSAQAQTAGGPGTAYNKYMTAQGSGTFGNNGSIRGLFTNVFTFVVTTRGLLAADFTNSASRDNGVSDIDFSGATLTGNGTSTSFAKLVGEPVSLTELWGITPFNVKAGTYTLTVSGRAYGRAATYAGNFNVAAVPEPATWAMMIGGIGIVGGAMRRRRVANTVSFA